MRSKIAKNVPFSQGPFDFFGRLARRICARQHSAVEDDLRFPFARAPDMMLVFVSCARRGAVDSHN